MVCEDRVQPVMVVKRGVLRQVESRSFIALHNGISGSRGAAKSVRELMFLLCARVDRLIRIDRLWDSVRSSL